MRINPKPASRETTELLAELVDNEGIKATYQSGSDADSETIAIRGALMDVSEHLCNIGADIKIGDKEFITTNETDLRAGDYVTIGTDSWVVIMRGDGPWDILTFLYLRGMPT